LSSPISIQLGISHIEPRLFVTNLENRFIQLVSALICCFV
jgi:hypothetical protein